MGRMGWWERGWSALFSPKLPPSVHHHSSAFLMRPEGAVDRAAEGAPRHPPPPHLVQLLTSPWPLGLADLLVERRPIHPDNTPTTHLAAVCTETHQFPPASVSPYWQRGSNCGQVIRAVIENQWRSCVSHSAAAAVPFISTPPPPPSPQLLL